MLKRASKTFALYASTTATTTISATTVIEDQNVEEIVLELNVTSYSATGGSFDVYFQQSLDGTNFRDVLRFNQVTASSASAWYARIAGNLMTRVDDGWIGQVGDATISASSVSGIPLISRLWRIKAVPSGANFTFSVNAFVN